jgi:hypothetical protein
VQVTSLVQSVCERAVSEAVKLVVNGYVSLKNREALEVMREHRQKLRKNLQEQSGGAFDISGSIRTIDGDLVEIEEGLARLQ